jgi:hypothetical protein
MRQINQQLQIMVVILDQCHSGQISNVFLGATFKQESGSDGG